jgi:hypothetical protein
MCNTLHKHHQKINKTGIGYKIFEVIHYNGTVMYRPMFFRGRVFDTKSFNKWNGKLVDGIGGDGFCFFLTKRGAQNYKYLYTRISRRLYIFKIKYKKGLGKMRHRPGKRSYTFSICKEFKILENK